MSFPVKGQIRFDYKGMDYEVDIDVYDSVTHRILLPDRTLLKVDSWLESNPPQPRRLTEIGNPYQGKGMSMEVVARKNHAFLATPRKPIIG